MKLFLLLLTTLGGLASLQAQNSKSPHKILIGFSFSPDYSYRTLNQNSGENSPVIDIRNNIEVAKAGFTAGVLVRFQISSLIDLETGVQFANKGYQTKNRELVYEEPAGPNDPTKACLKYVYQYIGIPLKVNFSFGNGRARFVTGAGITTNFLLGARNIVHLEYASGKKESRSQTTTVDFRKIDLSPMISAGLDYRLCRNTRFIVEPTFRYGLLNTMDAPVPEHLWSAGLNLAIYRSIK